MYKKILVPLDGSKTAEHALPLARSLARALQVPVELLAVVDIAEVARHVTADQSSMLRTLVDDTSRRLDKYLQTIAKNFPTGAVHYTVKNGGAAEVIVELAAPDSETLIVMATHGRSGLDRWLLGSVAEKVLRATANPLLLVRAVEKAPLWEMATLKRVIVPLDGSELSERILPFVETLAKTLGLDVVLFGVYGGPVSSGAAGDGFYNTAQIEAFVAGLRADTVEYLAAKAEEMKRRGFSKVSTVAKEGLSADEIIASAREIPDTLIAMCTHGRSGVKRWMLGSVTETVVRHSGAPVLVVRPS